MSEVLLADVGMFFLSIVLGFIILVVTLTVLVPRKSQEYRKVLTDMYVAAKIKVLAKADGLDIVEEFESFKKWKKKQSLNEKDLDNVIEGELKERVAEEKLKAKKEAKK